MKVVIINKSDATGGAAIVSFRLMKALREAGIDARMLVAEKTTDSPYVTLAASPLRLKRAFLTERLDIFRSLGFERRNLWKIDTGADGVPLWRHPLVRHADVVCLNWINQGFLSLKGVRRICALGKPVVWTMHDMWNMTGICHHAGDCNRFTHRCGDCHLLGTKKGDNDLSHRVWERKQKLYADCRITYVAVSRWLRGRAGGSSLMHDSDVRVIPNAFPLPSPLTDDERGHHPADTVRLIMGAARLDDPIKGLPLLVEASHILAAEPQGKKYELITYGTLKDASALDGMAIPVTHLGRIEGAEALRAAYSRADIVVSSSLFETLPGTLVEGQAFGCVPVAFDRGGQRDIIDHGTTGFLAEYDADITRAAENLADAIRSAASAISPQMRRNMYESVNKKFAAGNVAANYISLFNELLSRS